MTRPSCRLVLTSLFFLLTYSTVRAQSPDDLERNWQGCRPNLEKLRPGARPRLLTGPQTGYYFKVGNAIKTVAAEKSNIEGTSLPIEAIAAEQTRCNLLALETGRADFALVQSDIAHDAWYGHPPVRTTPVQNITLVAPLYVEAVHIVIRPHLDLARLADLRGRRVYLGRNGSLTVLSAKRILDAAGLTQAQVEELDRQEFAPDRSIEACRNSPHSSISELDPDCALKELQRLRLDAVFQVGVVPFDSLRDQIVPDDTNDGQLLDAERNKKPCDAVRKSRLTDPTLLDSELRLFSLDIDLVERLIADGSYIEQLIPPDAYCQQRATLTVGVRALLLTNRDASDLVVRRLAIVLNVNQQDIETNLRRQVEIEQKSHRDPVTGVPSRLSLLRVSTPDSLHVRYHDTVQYGKIYFQPWMEFLRNGLPQFAVGLSLLLFVLYRWRKLLGPWVVNSGEWAAGATILLILWMIVAWRLNLYEGKINEDYSSLSTAMRSTLENALGFNHGPVTQSGQNWFSWCRWIAFAIFGTMLLPSIKQKWVPKLWGKLKAWLLSFDHRPARAPTPPPPLDISAAPDHGGAGHPSPTS